METELQMIPKDKVVSNIHKKKYPDTDTIEKMKHGNVLRHICGIYFD
jgi:hypothetical protein